MIPGFRSLSALGALVFMHSAAAAPAIAVKKVPAGLTNVQLVQKLTPILEAKKLEQAKLLKQANAQVASALSAIEPERKILAATLNRDPRYKALLDQATRISGASGDAETRAAQMKALMGANRVVFTDAIRTAGMTAAALQSKVGKVAVKPDFSFQLSSASVTKISGLSNLSTAAPAAPADLTLLPPYDFESSDTDNGGLAYSAAHATTNAEIGYSKMHTTVIGVAGGASGQADVGQTISVPSGVKKVELTVSVKTSYSGAALAVIGMGSACTSVGVELWTADFSDRLDSEGDFECVSAIIGWYSEMSGDETRDYVLTANVSSGTHNLFLLGDTYAGAVGGGAPGYGEGRARVDITKIRVHFISN